MNEARAAAGYPRETAFSEKLRTIFGLTLGPWGTTALAPDGQPYVTLEGFGHEQEAAEAFSAYRASRPGDATVLHWRCQPEIACRGGTAHLLYAAVDCAPGHRPGTGQSA